MSVTDDTYTATGYPGGIFNDGFALSWIKDRISDAQPAPRGGQPWAKALTRQGDKHCIANQKLRLQTEDALADTLLVCWRRLDEVPDDAVLPWAYAVARHCLANAERSQRRQRRTAARIAVVDPPTEVPPGPGERDDALHEALAALRDEEAELLRLSAWEQLGPGEIAAVLGVSPNAVSLRLHRARQRLREELRKIEAAAGHEESKEGRTR